jgi:hypothetical protein
VVRHCYVMVVERSSDARKAAAVSTIDGDIVDAKCSTVALETFIDERSEERLTVVDLYGEIKTRIFIRADLSSLVWIRAKEVIRR